MPTTRETYYKHQERLRREAAVMSPGPPCPICKQPTSAKLVAATGDERHPACV